MAVYVHSLFIDFNSFFASVEQELRPELRERPVAVVPLLAETTCCIAASYQAKTFGVKTGTPVHEARRLCPELIVVEARAEHYVRYHRLLCEVIAECGLAPVVRSIDEVHCALWGEWMEVGAATELAARIKQAIARKAGPRMTCSIGLAPNEFLSKTASDMEKPDGLIVILPADLPGCLHRLELRDLYGIGPRMEARLSVHAINSVKHLCDASKEMLRAVWGGIEGERFHASLHGQPTATRPGERRTLGHSHILPPDLRHEAGAQSVLHRLTQKAAMRLRSYRCVAGGMGIFVRYPGKSQDWNDEVDLLPTQDTMDLLRVLDLLWTRRSGAGEDEPPFAVGVNLFDLADEKSQPLPLFDAGKQQRHAALLVAMDDINLHRGRNKVYFAGAHGAIHYAPMRIAFNRIPTLEEEGSEAGAD